MPAAIITTCVDPRLNHDLLRFQLRQKVAELDITADSFWILNEVAGNLGSNFGNLLEVLVRREQPLAFCAVLRHDDCLAAAAGVQTPLDVTLGQMAERLAEHEFATPIHTGMIRTADSTVTWQGAD